jgi:hypothetical protein
MKSLVGFLMLLFSATMALADDYQIIPGSYMAKRTDPNVVEYRTLVVDVTTGPIHLCIGKLDRQTSAISVGCEKVTVSGATMPPGPAALSPLGAEVPGPGLGLPGIWKASGGIVTFCSNNVFGLEPNLYCATTPLR